MNKQIDMNDNYYNTSISIISRLFKVQLNSQQIEAISNLKNVPKKERDQKIYNITGINLEKSYLEFINSLTESPNIILKDISNFLINSTTNINYPISELDPQLIKTVMDQFAQISKGFPSSTNSIIPILPYLIVADPISTLSALYELINSQLKPNST